MAPVLRRRARHVTALDQCRQRDVEPCASGACHGYLVPALGRVLFCLPRLPSLNDGEKKYSSRACLPPLGTRRLEATIGESNVISDTFELFSQVLQ